MALIRTCLLALIVLAPAIAQGRERCAAVVGSAAGGDVSVDVLIPWPHLPWGRHTAVSWRPRAIGWGITLDLFYPHGSLQGFGAPTGARISLANPEVMPADFRFVIAVGKQTWSVPGERSNDTPFSAKQDFLEQAVIDSRSQPDLLRSLGRASTLYVIAIWDGPLARATTTFSLDKAAVKARDDLLAEV
jgi:hypothetical protein